MIRADEKQEAIESLRKLGVKPGSDVYSLVTHVSASGMTRHVRCYIATTETTTDAAGKRRRLPVIQDITGLVANAVGYRRARGPHWDIVVGGCGFDAGFEVVYNLGRTMFPKCGPLDKSNGTRIAQAVKVGEKTIERDGGYLLSHRSM